MLLLCNILNSKQKKSVVIIVVRGSGSTVKEMTGNSGLGVPGLSVLLSSKPVSIEIQKPRFKGLYHVTCLLLRVKHPICLYQVEVFSQIISAGAILADAAFFSADVQLVTGIMQVSRQVQQATIQGSFFLPLRGTPTTRGAERALRPVHVKDQ